MKKILIAFDGNHFAEGAFEFVLQLHYLQPIMLTGVFLPQLSFSGLWSYAGGMNVPELIPYAEPEDAVAIEKNIERFQKLCTENKIKYTVHKDFYDFALPELRRETRFADLLILNTETFYDQISGESGADYLKEAIHIAECPVITVPENFNFPEKVLMAYDGSESSVYAMRQFVYLFPELSHLEVMVFCIRNEKGEGLPDELYISEFISSHFKDFKLVKLNMSNKKQLSSWLNDKKAILVSGSFGRNFFSQLFRESFISNIIEEHKYPIFITHK